MLRFYLLFVLVIAVFKFGMAQDSISGLETEDTYDSIVRDSTYIPDPELVLKYNPVKPIWIPLAEVVGINVGIWAFNRYVTDASHAYISWESVKNNFKNGWDWDADNLLTNMWAHPFQGSMYYNFARSSGYGYYTSLGVTAFGSFQWEFFMETEPPAINDFIMTSFGGAMYGEMFYRMSNMILNESLSGASRTWNEIGAGVFNPARLMNRLFYGRTARVIEPKLYERNPRVGEIGFGMNNVADGTDFQDGDKNGMLTFEYLYGNPFKSTTYKPMDYFHFWMALNFGGNQPALGQFRIHGIVAGKQKTFSNKHKLIWGLFQYIDYMHNSVYEIAGYSIAPGIAWRSPKSEKHLYVANLNVGFMPMGAANSEYAPNHEVPSLDSARTYNMGPGASARLSFTYVYSDLLEFSLKYSFWWVHTAQGAPGDEYIGLLQPKLIFHVYKDWYVGLQYLLYHRKGVYDDYPNVDLRNNEQRLFISWRF